MTTLDRGRWAGRIRPGHPAFAQIQDAITGWEPRADTAGAPTTADILAAVDIPAGSLNRYLRELRLAGWITARKSGRGFIWSWVGQPVHQAAQMAAETITATTVGRTNPTSIPAVLADVSGPILRVQLSPAVTTPDGHTSRPSPFIIYPLGGIGAQDYWQGRPLAAIGFSGSSTRERIDLWWGDYVTAGDWPAAVGRYLITENDEGIWAAQLTPVESVEEVARVQPTDVAA